MNKNENEKQDKHSARKELMKLLKIHPKEDVANIVRPTNPALADKILLSEEHLTEEECLVVIDAVRKHTQAECNKKRDKHQQEYFENVNQQFKKGNQGSKKQ